MMSKTLSLLLCLLCAPATAWAGDFTVHTTAAPHGRLSADGYANSFGCAGANISPDIVWNGAPAATKSFLVTLYDHDAPSGSGWWHWLVADIPATVTALPRGAGSGQAALPTGAVQFNTDLGQPGYLGACPPPGQIHRYTITVKALTVAKLDVPPQATAAMVGFVSNMAALAQATTSFTAQR
ncbi:YbhB/YbcL family Raf kinase inhibitor-like protein [Magnetospirillum sulfuroxidans]|nr:YbhB/YbcL family Raf kinase inhibitor-like protein [Magnetospirillum sulfuroxidans]